ncbi:MAG: hypothetical protein A3B74_01985 [Candidatus Kerfeldbacteria bacterium RIFCSPHIGHO2_02_FULL_42_14]|uniref:NYN domain-containing protein n=1 Tax=Candidatus Kerfeldbacteria bacterium RIFCSPHIGHO2_02_FULL_42_14 TaxID=1798540 RepID=A0A1G2APM1_9BACT|nr:MAG: hypothetical protein A3B74_01985 [Candidatus Kerfeldbacteria bacterium RIFCSPHIGHO2_02_FULL_42_14]OGY81788.1 MAG: hypothetical protein A3E60_00560 [Candidatus Kerfeldbacteria bacterium RIFCSPHIGHO2_12_FULL_42_13]OGY84477.1 MAG: hypothetical protein A3I91_00175 [Candidatus Kerfeldbacteria bacterium RIFCSPLOWO2_02_FULL_42_19]OGY87983.1 MAG: hypothetical protein A3G01_04155 [Candidatus Kerfeldbacteria bacterium RIFCSPLOWO2_12_FULL_43_9]
MKNTLPQPEQRVGVFVDIQNMYYSAKHLFDSKVDFGKILAEAVAGRKLIRAMAYVIKADVGEEAHFFEALNSQGYEVRVKELQTFYSGVKKGDWDVGVSMDVVRLASKIDVVVLVSGDGDYAELIKYVKALGCKAEIMAFGESSSIHLREAADDFINLSEFAEHFLIKNNGKIKKRRIITGTKNVNKKEVKKTE